MNENNENTPPAERPTPETDEAWNAPSATHVQRAHNVRNASRNLERQLAEAREKTERQGEYALMAEKRLGEALALAESNGKLAHDTAIELREAREQRDLWEKRAIQYSAEREHNAMVAKMMEAQRDNAISDWKQSDTDSIRAIHERNEAREQRDRLADALINLKVGLENEQAHGLWDADDIIDGVINPALTIAGFRITSDPTLPPGTGEIRDPKTGETIITIKES